jgi:hypothetical protein
VEVPAAEAVRLMADRLHLRNVGKCGEEEARRKRALQRG